MTQKNLRLPVLASILLLLSIYPSKTFAQSFAESISMHSEYYDLYGEGAAFNILLGSTEAGKVSVDCGYGATVYDIAPVVFDSSTSMSGTIITCTLSPSGNVAITTSEGIYLDYVDVSGCGLTSIDFAYPQYIEVLNVEHNSLSALDLSDFVNAYSLNLGDNPYSHATPLKVGANKPHLAILDMNVIDNVDPSFSLSDYPSLLTFDAMSNPWMQQCDPTGCPQLLKLSIDATNVASLDLSGNPNLTILNISDTAIREIDLSHNPRLTQLYCDHYSGTYNRDVKLESLDLSNNPELIYLFCSNNALASIDLSNNPNLRELFIRNNYLTDIDLTDNQQLINVMISGNMMDYNTLPLWQDGWLDYEYKQRQMQVPRSYLVGSQLDLKPQLIRPDGSVTTAVLYYENAETPGEYTPVSTDKYTFIDGVLTINEVIPDSVFCEFYNSLFDQCALATRKFKVKDNSTFGKPEIAAELTLPYLTTSSTLKLKVGIAGATPDKPRTFYVDLGDGELIPFTAKTQTTPAEPNVSQRKGSYGTVKVYVEDGDDLTALAFADSYISEINLTHAMQLRELTLENTAMYNIDLAYNRCLERLTLTGNHFDSRLTLEGSNGSNYKNALAYINLSNNELTDLKLSPIDAIEYLDLSNNHLSSINLTDAEYIRTLNLSHNDFEFLKINYLSALRDLDVSYNKLASMILPETNNIDRFVLNHNCFTMATMPSRNGISEDNFIYAPQALIDIPKKGPNCNLNEQNVAIDGYNTMFTWICDNGDTLTEGVDYNVVDGITCFTDAAIGKKAYCSITNAALPAFTGDNALKTTIIEIAGAPSHLIGEFTVVQSTDNIRLSLASALPGDAIYIDWGDGALTQYPLETTYTLYNAQAQAGTHAKIYSYDDDSMISVFSISGVQLSDIDLQNMRHLNCLAINGAGIDQLVMPQSPELKELMLPQNEFSSFDFSAYPALQSINFEGNHFESVDLTGMTNLQEASFSNNGLSSITFGNNPQLWGLYLANNNLAEVNLTPLTSLYQVILSNNQLSSINLERLPELHVVFIDNNNFTFATLPLPRQQWTLYSYYNQRAIPITLINNSVNLSNQSVVNGEPTVFTWYEGIPQYDEELGEYVGNTLIEGLDYTVSRGFTTFKVDHNNVMCLLTNPTFPNAIMYTTTVDITGGASDALNDHAGIKVRGNHIEVSAQPNASITIYSASGMMVCTAKADGNGLFATRLNSGVYVVDINGETTKIIIK